MGNTTVIELNHDRWDEIFHSEETEKEFLNQIRRQYSAFEFSGKQILGGEVICGFHRSGIIYEAWMKFKKRWRDRT